MTDWLRPLLSIVLVLALAAGLRWWLARPGLFRGRWRGRRPASGRLETLDRLALSPQHTLHLVRVGDRAVLIGSHPAGCTVLETLPAEALRAPQSALEQEVP